MALANYNDLFNAVANWLHRSDLTATIPDFIALAEAKMNRQLRLRDQETRATATLAGEYLALPTDFLEVRNIQLNTSPVRNLVYMSPEMLDLTFAGEPGDVQAYTIVANQFQFAPIGSGTVEITYFAKIAALSVTNPTNFALTNWPDAYLYGALLEAAPYLNNDARAQTWLSLYGAAIESIKRQDWKARYGSSPAVRSSTTCP